MKTVAIIPARLESTRLPRKPLLDVFGKPLVVRVYEEAQRFGIFDEVHVAIDDEEVAHVLETFDIPHLMTRKNHTSGTSRCIECAEVLCLGAEDVLVNIQGDEPFIASLPLQEVVEALEDAGIASLYHPIKEWRDLESPHTVKVTINLQGKALLFSRSAIPYLRDVPKQEWLLQNSHFQHVGIYAFRVATLQCLGKLSGGFLYLSESLEQLQWMEHGYSIAMVKSDSLSYGIDTLEDYNRVLSKKKPQHW